MALADSMKNFVNDLKASRRSRHGFVKGNREIAKNIMADNRKFLENIRAQNKINAEQTHMFLKSAKETRAENFKRTKEEMKESMDRVHQAVSAIRQGAKGMITEFRSDAVMAHKYWMSLETDDPIEEPGQTKAPKVAKKPEIKVAPKIESKKEIENVAPTNAPEKQEPSTTEKESTDQSQRESG
jgi:Tfp pilus assembly protein PilE